MVRKENVQARGNSLLLTATSKRAGPGRFASLVRRGTAKPPVRKVNVDSSDVSRISDMTASVVDNARPAVIKEVKIDDIEMDIESSVLEMSVKSSDSFSITKAFASESPMLGNQKKTTPQPSAYQLPPKKDSKPMEKKTMEIQPGIRIVTPSPMTLDRVQVQMGQEHTVPASDEYKRQEEEKRIREEKERQKKEYHKAKKEVVKRLKEDLHNELGEGFEAQLEDEPDTTSPGKKKSLVKKILRKIRPKSPKKPLTADDARAMARKAMERSRKSQNAPGKPPLPRRVDLPFQEITMNAKEDSVSDLDSSGKKIFPVKEIMMNDGDDSRDDESISTLGTAHVLERMRPAGQDLQATSRYHGDHRDPTPTGEIEELDRKELLLSGGKISSPIGTNALIDQIDSGTLTDDAGALTGTFNNCHPKNQDTNPCNPSHNPFGFALAVMCMNGVSKENISKRESSQTEVAETYQFLPPDIPATVKPSTQNSPAVLQSALISKAPEDFPSTQDFPETASPTAHSRTSTMESPISPGTKFSSAIDAAISDIKKGMKNGPLLDSLEETSLHEISTFSGINLKKTLSPIEEDFTPVHAGMSGARMSMPELEDDDAEHSVHSVHNNAQKEPRLMNAEIKDEKIIDLTDLASPMSPSTQDGIKGGKDAATGAFSFDSLMDIAASKLGWKVGEDRYAVEGDESPRRVIRGCAVEGNVPDTDAIPVVKGVEIKGKACFKNETTPKARGSNRSPIRSFSQRFGDSTNNLSLDEMTSEVSPQSSFEVYEHPEGDIVMWSENPVQTRKTQADQTTTPNRFTGYFSDGLFDLLSMDESVSRGRKKVPFLSSHTGHQSPVKHDSSTNEMSGVAKDVTTRGAQEILSDDDTHKTLTKDENSEDLSAQEGAQGEKMDPNVGVMCGAVPLYFMYNGQNQGKNKKESDSINQEGSDKSKIEIENGSIADPDAKELNSVEESPKVHHQPKGFLPMASPKKDRPLSATENPEHDLKPDISAQVVREKVLLEKDDAFWDTLSTIASTKDKSAGSAKIVSTIDAKPGPIPIEITMTTAKMGEGESSEDSSTVADDRKKAMENLTDLIDEEKSTGSLSERLAAFKYSQELPAQKEGKTHTMTINEVKMLGRANNSTLSYSPRGPPSPISHGESQQEYSFGRSNAAEAAHKRGGGDDVSDDNSGLLLAVTRSEGDEEGKFNGKCRSYNRNTFHKLWSTDDGAEDAPSKGRSHSNNASDQLWSRNELHTSTQDPLCNDFYNEAKGAFEEAALRMVAQHTSTSSHPKQQRVSTKSNWIAPENDRRNRYGMKTFQPSPNAKSPPTAPVVYETPKMLTDCNTGPIGTILSGNAFTNPWKNSNRSVSWGFEEIYEAAELVDSEVPQSHHEVFHLPKSDPPTTNHMHKAIMTASAEAAATKAALGETTTRSPTSFDSHSGYGDSVALSDMDEEELISRTLQLSKELLASMTTQDLEGADNEMVRSLLSFGTEDGKLSLAETKHSLASTLHAQDPPQTTSLNENSSDEETTTQEKSSWAVMDPAEAVARTAIPASVRIHNSNSRATSWTPVPTPCLHQDSQKSSPDGHSPNQHALNDPTAVNNNISTTSCLPTSVPADHLGSHSNQQSPEVSNGHSKVSEQGVLDDKEMSRSNTPTATSCPDKLSKEVFGHAQDLNQKASLGIQNNITTTSRLPTPPPTHLHTPHPNEYSHEKSYDYTEFSNQVDHSTCYNNTSRSATPSSIPSLGINLIKLSEEEGIGHSESQQHQAASFGRNKVVTTMSPSLASLPSNRSLLPSLNQNSGTESFGSKMSNQEEELNGCSPVSNQTAASSRFNQSKSMSRSPTPLGTQAHSVGYSPNQYSHEESLGFSQASDQAAAIFSGHKNDKRSSRSSTPTSPATHSPGPSSNHQYSQEDYLHGSNQTTILSSRNNVTSTSRSPTPTFTRPLIPSPIQLLEQKSYSEISDQAIALSGHNRMGRSSSPFSSFPESGQNPYTQEESIGCSQVSNQTVFSSHNHANSLGRSSTIPQFQPTSSPDPSPNKFSQEGSPPGSSRVSNQVPLMSNNTKASNWLSTPTLTQRPCPIHESQPIVLYSGSHDGAKAANRSSTPQNNSTVPPIMNQHSQQESFGLSKASIQPSLFEHRGENIEAISQSSTPTSSHFLRQSWSEPFHQISTVSSSGHTNTRQSPATSYFQMWSKDLSSSSSNHEKGIRQSPRSTDCSPEPTSNQHSLQESSAFWNNTVSPSSLQTQQGPVAGRYGETTSNKTGGHFEQPVIFHVLNRPTVVHNVDSINQRTAQTTNEHPNPIIVTTSSGAISESTCQSHSTNSQERSTYSSTNSQGRSLEGSRNDLIGRQNGSISARPSSSGSISGSRTASPSPIPSPQEDATSVRPTASGLSGDSPIDVEALFNKYDTLANHLIEENTELKHLAMTRPPVPAIDENSSSTSSSPKNVVVNRLDELRAQRERAIAVLHKDNQRQFGDRVQVGNAKEKDRLSHYTRPQSAGRNRMMMMDLSTMEQQQNQRTTGARPRSAERPFQIQDLDSVSTSSDVTTPSMKARALRIQLDEALRASRTIRQSQEQLGYELETFKERFYHKNDALEDQAFRAIGGL